MTGTGIDSGYALAELGVPETRAGDLEDSFGGRIILSGDLAHAYRDYRDACIALEDAHAAYESAKAQQMRALQAFSRLAAAGGRADP